MVKLTTLAIATMVSVALESGAVAAESAQKLSGVQIRAKFIGMQLTDEVHFRDVYDRDGTLRSYSDGKMKAGKWTIEKNEICIYFKEPDDGCYEVWLSTGRIEMKPSGLGLSIEGILQAPTDRN
jgi:hypothetical protein